MRAREPVVPGKFIFVPHRPQESEEKSSRGKKVARAAQKRLSGRGRLARKADHLQASHHHSRGRPPEDGEEREVLQIDDGESHGVNSGVQLTQGKLPAEGTEEHQEATIGEQQTEAIDQRREATIIHGSQWVKSGLRLPFVINYL